MGWVFSRPTLVAIEITWRWLFGIPFLLVCLRQAQSILSVLTPESAGLTSIDTQNPWVAVTQLANAWTRYQPHVAGLLSWLVPPAILAWVIASGIGRNVLLMRIEPGTRFRPMSMIVLQAVWLAVWSLVMSGWFLSMRWAATVHIVTGGEPDLIGFAIWTIFLSLSFFTLWALVSWPFAIAPVLMLKESRSATSTLSASLQLGRDFTGKLMETNLVMGIVKLALIVLAMVFSAAPLPFSDQLGPEALHAVYAASLLFYIAASDYFHVIRLKGYVEFWRTFRSAPAD